MREKAIMPGGTGTDSASTATNVFGKDVRRTSRLNKRKRTKPVLATVSILALAATGAGLAPASATVGPAGIAAGINISVFHNIDMVATFGWPEGQPVQVEVFRNNVPIGTATGDAFDTPDGGALEVNHGPLGAPVAGDCWEGHTPDIRPGDLVRVTSGGTVNEVIVDNLDLTGPAELNPETGDVEVRGVALTAAGAEIPLADLDSGEFRTVLAHGQFRANPDAIVDDPTVLGGFIMQYKAPYDGFRSPAGSTPEERRDALLNEDGHMVGFGHTAPLPDEAMLVEGFEDASGPAAGCEGSPFARDAVTSTNPSKNLNLLTTGAATLQIGGMSFDSTAVEIQVGTLPAVPAVLSPGVGSQTWTASVPMSEVLTLPDGDVTVAMTTTRAGAALAGASAVLRKDLVAPGAPTVSPNGGAINGQRSVFITGAAGDLIRYTVGNGNQAAPTTTSGIPFTGPFNVGPGQTVKAIAVDAADNISAVTTASFTQAPPAVVTPPVVPPVTTPPAGPQVVPPVVTPPGGASSAVVPLAPSIGQARSGKAGGAKTATATWRVPRANGAILRGYEVRALKVRPGTSDKVHKLLRVAPGATALKLSLPAGTYRFQVRAISTAGGSPWSERSNKVRAR